MMESQNGNSGLIVTLLLLAASLGPAQHRAGRTIYRSIEVAQFSIGGTYASTGALPDDWRILLETELIKQLGSLKKFELVARESSHAELPEPALRLEGTIREVKRGSSLKRWLEVPGVGNTKITAHVVFLDKSTGSTVAEDNVSGSVYSGPYTLGQFEKSRSAVRYLADNIVQIARKNFFPSTAILP